VIVVQTVISVPLEVCEADVFVLPVGYVEMASLDQSECEIYQLEKIGELDIALSIK